MSIEKTYRNDKEVLKVSDISEKYHNTFETLIITFQSKVLEGLLKHDLIDEIKDRKFGSAHGKSNIYKLKSNPKILFFLCPIGAPTVVGVLEEIGYAMNIKNIVLYGSCGVLDKNIKAGKIIVPTKAYRDEGTSYHYAPASDFIDIVNYEFVSKVLSANHIDFIKGYTWTTDAFYRETKTIFEERKKQGCIAVEMEVSAVQAFANLRGINLYTFLYSADNLDAPKWNKRILGNLPVDKRIVYFMIATKIAEKISIKGLLQ